MSRCPSDSYIHSQGEKRQVGRPRKRWLDEVNSVAREIWIRRRWTRALDTGEWGEALKGSQDSKRVVVLMMMCWVERKVFAFSKRWRKQTKKFLQGRN
jgi:uncharacterized protein YeaC (DUF1315 family)